MYGGKTLAPPCYLLVLAPPATSVRGALEYRPFNNLTLSDIVGVAVKHAQDDAGPLGELSFPYYDISEAFFFGKTITREIVESLSDVPSAILDCDVYQTESSAIDDVERALLAFKRAPGKIVYQIARNGIRSGIHPGPLITREQQLIDVLEAHLWSHRFAAAMAKHDRH